MLWRDLANEWLCIHHWLRVDWRTVAAWQREKGVRGEREREGVRGGGGGGGVADRETETDRQTDI